MKLTINVTEALYAVIEERVGEGNVEKEVEKLVYKFGGIPSGERTITIWGKDRLLLEGIFQTTIDDSTKLYQMLRNVASLKIGTIERVFSPSEVIRLTDQARFHGWTVEKFLELTSNEALDYVMDRM